MITLAVFVLFAVLAVVAAVLVVVQKNVMHSVLYLAFTVLATAGVFFALQAEYLGAIQILVYVGGIVVLYIFVIVIVNLKEIVPERRSLVSKLFLVGIPVLLCAEIISGASAVTGTRSSPVGSQSASTLAAGQLLSAANSARHPASRDNAPSGTTST